MGKVTAYCRDCGMWLPWIKRQKISEKSTRKPRCIVCKRRLWRENWHKRSKASKLLCGINKSRRKKPWVPRDRRTIQYDMVSLMSLSGDGFVKAFNKIVVGKAKYKRMAYQEEIEEYGAVENCKTTQLLREKVHIV